MLTRAWLFIWLNKFIIKFN